MRICVPLDEPLRQEKELGIIAVLVFQPEAHLRQCHLFFFAMHLHGIHGLVVHVLGVSRTARLHHVDLIDGKNSRVAGARILTDLRYQILDIPVGSEFPHPEKRTGIFLL